MRRLAPPPPPDFSYQETVLFRGGGGGVERKKQKGMTVHRVLVASSSAKAHRYLCQCMLT